MHTPSTHFSGQYLKRPPFLEKLPVPIFFRTENMPAHATYPVMRHAWGEFVYSFHGITEVKAGKEHYIIPPNLAMWIPEGVEHIAFNHQEAVHSSLYIARNLCLKMPKKVCAVVVPPLVRSILDHLRELPGEEKSSVQTRRVLRVLVDQIAACRTTGSYLPHTNDPQLQGILQELYNNPSDNRSLRELADAFHISERTLIRRCHSDLGMSLTEWRQRLRLVNSLPLLQMGQSVESIAFDLGYSTSSAFIAMFRRFMGTSPGRFMSQRDPS